MKIAIIIERAQISLGGAERSGFELAEALSAFDHNVHILAANGRLKADNVYILCQDRLSKRIRYCTFKKALKKHLTENRYDIIHSFLPFDFADVYQPRGGCYPEAVFRNAVSYQNKLLISLKKITAFTNFRRASLQHAEKKLIKNDIYITVAALSEYVADQFKHHYKIFEDQLKIIPNGVKIHPPVPTSHSKSLRGKLLSKLNLSENEKPILFLFTANNFRLKGLTPLIKALHLAVCRDKNTAAYLIITGSDKPDKYKHLAAKLKIENRLLFTGPFPDIQTALTATDVAVLPTFYDPASRFILEALAAKKPVITTSFNGATDLFTDNRHGKIIDSPENIQDLATAVTFYMNKENIKKTTTAIAADHLEEKISISRVAGQLTSLYKSKLEKGRQK